MTGGEARLTSGTISVRIRRLSVTRPVRRAEGAADARSRPITVTAAGRRL
jgi:DNA-binding MarR family transcriptional regulator